MKAISILYQNSFKLWREILRQKADAEAERNKIKNHRLKILYFKSTVCMC